MSDPRVTLARLDLADARLEGVVAARAYAPTTPLRVAVASTALNRGPDAASERMDELIYGEAFDALGEEAGYVWGQARRDGYVGFVDSGALTDAGAPATHRVAAIRSFAFTEPSIKARAAGPFSLNALVTVVGEDGAFAQSDEGLWFWKAHLAPIGAFEADPAAVATRFLGAPYLWGGRTSIGLDCSGLVQQAHYACGVACPRDTDQQATLGRAAPEDGLARGDLVCWKGHIGMLLDSGRLLHANAFHMCVAIEPLSEALDRIGPPSALRRVLAEPV
jgi:cell wall-associated NlpC family hydrolase